MSSLSKLFKSQAQSTADLESITNPFDLDFSMNFSFDDNTRCDVGASDTNLLFSQSQLLLASGSTGTFISSVKSTDSEVTQASVKAKGESLLDATFYVSSDNGNNWVEAPLDMLITLSSPGKNLRLKIMLGTSGGTQLPAKINAAAVYYG